MYDAIAATIWVNKSNVKTVIMGSEQYDEKDEEGLKKDIKAGMGLKIGAVDMRKKHKTLECEYCDSTNVTVLEWKGKKYPACHKHIGDVKQRWGIPQN
jgi:hypothetical protein